MKKNNFALNATLLALLATFGQGGYAAEDDENVTQMDTMEVRAVAEKPAVPANMPSTSEAVTAKQIDENINTVTSAGALQYLPSVHVRERYVGDLNGILVMRINSSTSSAQTTVYADGLLLSNFLNNSFSTAPRWGMVSPDELDRVDVMYGPFSALYPGNSAGGVVNMSTRMPKKFEGHAKLDVFGEKFKEYGTNDRYTGMHASGSVGNKSGNWSWIAGADHLDNHGHPMTFTSAANTTRTGTGTVVTGAIKDIDTANNPRVITSAASIDHTVQDNGKIKVAYDITPTVRASYSLGIWQNTSDKTGESYLRDPAGNTIYGTGSATSTLPFVLIDGNKYTVTAPSTSRALAESQMHGLALKTSTGGEWDWEAIASLYNVGKDETRTSSGNFGTTPSTAATAGTIAIANGTNWWNLDVRGDWRPDGDMKSKHQVSFGVHGDHYKLKTDTYNLLTGTNWLTSAIGALASNSRGETETQAVYLQDAVQLNPALKVTAGVRVEQWKASNGSNFASNAIVTYPNKMVNDFSPKLSVAYQAKPDLALRASYGKASRFPTVNELFANLTIRDAGGTAVTNFATLPPPYNTIRNDANLKPESVNSLELAAEKFFDQGAWRTSFFAEDKYDALISQTDSTTLPGLGATWTGYTISSVQNVDNVQTWGVETAWQFSDVLLHGFDFNGSVTYANSTIKSNAKNPGLAGTDQPRIPDWRATLVGTYHASDKLSGSLSYRFSGRQHNSLFNTTTGQYTDPNPDVYGAVSHYSVFDTKLTYKFTKQWTGMLGINNLNDFKYYVNPNPYPQRTYYASVKLDM